MNPIQHDDNSQHLARNSFSVGYHIQRLRTSLMNKEADSKARARTIFLTVHTHREGPLAYPQWFQVSCPSPRCEDGYPCRPRRWQPACSSSLALSPGHPQQGWSLCPLSFQNLHDILPEKKGKTTLTPNEIFQWLRSLHNFDKWQLLQNQLHLDYFPHICVFSNYSKNSVQISAS